MLIVRKTGKRCAKVDYMKVNILFFGILREKAGVDTWEVEGVPTLDSLRAKIETTLPELKGQVYLTAVNQDLVRGNPPLADGDEIAIMPPFAGG